MPLIIICGTPVSGKTYRAKQLKAYFEKTRSKNVEIISEVEVIKKLGYELNSFYLDFQKEKRVRGYLKSEVIKLIGKDNVVILDGSNYIKGYRYELYCASKASKSTQCTVYTLRSHEDSWQDNLKRSKERDISSECVAEGEDNVAYTQEVFEGLTKFRFEEPNPNNRWDSPLFTVLPDDELDLEKVHQALFERKPPPPNMSTQNPPLSSTDFLYDLDRVTREISQRITDAKAMSVDEVRFAEHPGCVLEAGFTNNVNPQKLLRLRRQFLTYAKMHHINEDANKLGRYYIQYLNKSLAD